MRTCLFSLRVFASGGKTHRAFDFKLFYFCFFLQTTFTLPTGMGILFYFTIEDAARRRTGRVETGSRQPALARAGARTHKRQAQRGNDS